MHELSTWTGVKHDDFQSQCDALEINHKPNYSVIVWEVSGFNVKSDPEV